MDLIVDTCVFADVQRGKIDARLALTNRSHAYATNWIVIAGLLEGQTEEFVKALVAEVEILQVDYETAGEFAQIRRLLRSEGRLIGDHDIWIAATALRHGFGVLTNNRRDFQRIPNLAVVSY